MTTPAPTPPMTLTFEASSNILAARLDEATGVLEVDFKNGTTYSYPNFTAAKAAEWQAAKSAGSWFDANVKKHPALHPATKLPSKAAENSPPAPATPAPAPSAAPAPAAPAPAAAAASASQAPTTKTPASPAAPAAASEPKVSFDDSPAEVRVLAQEAYEAYIANSDGKAWDGRPCPTWDELRASKSPVPSHWCAAVLRVAQPKLDMITQVAHLTQVARQAEEIANSKLDAQVRDRTQMLDGECTKLREQLAAAEARLRAKPFPPWRSGQT